MAGWDNAVIPFFVVYILYQIPPTLHEVYAYYVRGGLVKFDIHMDETFTAQSDQQRDNTVYMKRFCDRPTSEAAKAFYGYLDWSSSVFDKSIMVGRRNLAKKEGEVWGIRPYIFGPFVFNWPKKQWLRGDDAAGMKAPMWGNGGEERAREEFAAAKEKGFDVHWHYSMMRRIRRQQEAKKAAAAAAAAAAAQ
mmetsp:Transcript_54116/g.62229  ORF Transcript_54116/g.62229 Transcript_54116/m.62229 type:complete len:192 (-) Transcript_54116:378-953(-)|eukprot:CAMPEP_0176413772 /NCGR_PEP_ID=MMETSP0127-20121128/4886_1 /TAXON_ID=938130 /ORGANISM="Platyophrya macrostoma, Strain WH" /LENGTH=191 /DNA_ID=CAMNT_0017793593 /DNA_START=81 /DNA_END=656 /DNA_ORIENTATION=-